VKGAVSIKNLHVRGVKGGERGKHQKQTNSLLGCHPNEGLFVSHGKGGGSNRPEKTIRHCTKNRWGKGAGGKHKRRVG